MSLNQEFARFLNQERNQKILDIYLLTRRAVKERDTGRERGYLFNQLEDGPSKGSIGACKAQNQVIKITRIFFLEILNF